jgi:hypothetical protein
MATTFLKRQKEMKRLEKAREKAERRAQKKLEGSTGPEIERSSEWDNLPPEDETLAADVTELPGSGPRN